MKNARRNSHNLAVVFMSLLAIFLCACSKEPVVESEQKPEAIVTTNIAVSLDENAADAWFSEGEKVLNGSLELARILQNDIAIFLDNPDENHLRLAQNTWSQLAGQYAKFYPWYLLADADPDSFRFLNELHFRIANWPIQPGSLDYFGEYLYSGLVHEVGNPLTMQNLLELHGQVDSENATLGIYALGFMLLGENNLRPASDYQALSRVSNEFKERGFSKAAELPNNRRRILLSLQSGILVDDIKLLASLWIPTSNNSQTMVWQNQSALKKQQLIESSLERGIASLLVFEEYTEDKSQLQARLSALSNLPPILQHPRLAEMQNAFSDLDKLLSDLQEEESASTSEPTESRTEQEVRSASAETDNEKSDTTAAGETPDEIAGKQSELNEQLSRLHKLVSSPEEENASL